MLEDKHITPHLFGVFTIYIIDIGESTAGAGGKNDNHSADRVPEEKPLEVVENCLYRWILFLEVVQKIQGNDT